MLMLPFMKRLTGWNSVTCYDAASTVIVIVSPCKHACPTWQGVTGEKEDAALLLTKRGTVLISDPYVSFQKDLSNLHAVSVFYVVTFQLFR